MNSMSPFQLIVASAVIGLLIITALMFGLPVYGVWQQGLSGEAALKRAEQEKQITIEIARAERESAVLRAEAIQIVGQATKDFPEYRQQEFIGALGEALRDGNIEQIMYLPTEAMIPITEAGKRP